MEARAAADRDGDPQSASSIDEAVAMIPALYSSLRAPLTLALVNCTRDPAGAEDLVQEAFIRLVREARAGRMPQRPGAWLYRVANNLAISQARKASTLRRVQPRLLAPDRDDVSSPEARVLDREWAEDCAEALAAIAPATREVLLMAAAGVPRTVIARRVGRSEGATRTLLCRGRARLREIGARSFNPDL
jgi:RNA polymerase sigma-70 factor (ECF subfamily)